MVPPHIAQVVVAMSTNRTPTVRHSDWCPANNPDESMTACVAIREEPASDDQLVTDGGTKTMAVCQVCGVVSRVR